MFELSIDYAIPLFVSRQENLKMSSCVSAVLISLACDKHLSPGQLTDTFQPALHNMGAHPGSSK